MELAALERLKNRCHHVISVDIDLIFFKLAGNKDMHNIMNEYEFWTDRTTDYRVSCPSASKKYPYRSYNGENGVSTFSLLFGSFWYFHVTRTSIKAWMSLNFLKWDLTLAHWTQVSDRCPLGYLFLSYLSVYYYLLNEKAYIIERAMIKRQVKIQSPVVQSIVSLTKSLVNDLLSLLVCLKSSVLIFFGKKWQCFYV